MNTNRDPATPASPLWRLLNRLKLRLKGLRARLDWLATTIIVAKRMRFSLLFAIAASLALLTDQGKEILANSFGSAFQGGLFVASCVLAAISVAYTSRLLFDTWKDDPLLSEHTKAWGRWLRVWLPGGLGALVMFIPAVAIWPVAHRMPDAMAAQARWYSIVLLVMCALFLAALKRFHKRSAQANAGPERMGLNYTQLGPIATRFFVSMLVLNVIAIAAFAFLPLLPIKLGIGSGVIVMLAAGLAIVTGSLVAHLSDETRLPILSGLFAAAAVFSLWNDNHEVTLIDRSTRPRAARFDTQLALPAAPVNLDRYLAEKLGPRIAARARECRQSGRADCDPRVPFVVVAAEGGGVRAAAWTALVLAEIDRALADANAAEPFSQQTVAISGVSGGSLGAALYLMALRDRQSAAQPQARALWQRERDFFQTDLLTPILANMLFVDIPQRLLPFAAGKGWIPDRGTVFEKTIEHAWQLTAEDDARRNPFSADFQTLWQGEHSALPLLLANTTIVASGERMVQSPVRLKRSDAVAVLPTDEIGQDDPPLTHDIARDDGSFVGAYDGNDCLQSPQASPSQPITLAAPLSGVVHNSARFTWLSPAGRYGKRSACKGVRIVDGGYFENSGTATADDIVWMVNHMYPGRVRPVVVQIRNQPIDEAGFHFDCTHSRASKADTRTGPSYPLAEALDPLIALYNGRTARGDQAKLALKRRICGAQELQGTFIEFALFKNRGAKFPLHWAIAEDTLEKMEAQFRDPRGSNQRALRSLLAALSGPMNLQTPSPPSQP